MKRARSRLAWKRGPAPACRIFRKWSPAWARSNSAWAGDHFLKILHAGAGPRFQASRDLARFMLEGLARTTLTYDKDGRKERLLMLIKRATHMLNRKGDVQDLWPE